MILLAQELPVLRQGVRSAPQPGGRIATGQGWRVLLVAAQVARIRP